MVTYENCPTSSAYSKKASYRSRELSTPDNHRGRPPPWSPTCVLPHRIQPTGEEEADAGRNDKQETLNLKPSSMAFRKSYAELAGLD